MKPRNSLRHRWEDPSGGSEWGLVTQNLHRVPCSCVPRCRREPADILAYKKPNSAVAEVIGEGFTKKVEMLAWRKERRKSTLTKHLSTSSTGQAKLC